jgi:hypothetical protein
MKVFLLKLIATLVAIPMIILAEAAAMETYYKFYLRKPMRHEPDGLWLIMLMIPPIIAIWARTGIIGRRFAAWLVGTACLLGTVAIMRPVAFMIGEAIVFSSTTAFPGWQWMLFVAYALPNLAGIGIALFATWIVLRPAITSPE